MNNPVMTASGTFGYGIEFADFLSLEQLGGIIVKGTTLNHREGNPYPRMARNPFWNVECCRSSKQRCRLFCKSYLSQDKRYTN